MPRCTHTDNVFSPPHQTVGEKENSVKYLKPYFIFCARVTTLAWRASPPKNLSVLAAVIISALALIACPILLGYGVQRTLETPKFGVKTLPSS